MGKPNMNDVRVGDTIGLNMAGTYYIVAVHKMTRTLNDNDCYIYRLTTDSGTFYAHEITEVTFYERDMQ